MRYSKWWCRLIIVVFMCLGVAVGCYNIKTTVYIMGAGNGTDNATQSGDSTAADTTTTDDLNSFVSDLSTALTPAS